MSITGRYLRLPMSKILEVLERPETLLAVLYPDDHIDHPAGTYLDIDKTWQIIDYLIDLDSTDEKSALGGIVMGGAELSEEDLGYGPARFLSEKQVAALDVELRGLPSEVVWARYDPVSAERDGVSWSNQESARKYFETNYEALRDFVKSAAQSGEGIVLWLA